MATKNTIRRDYLIIQRILRGDFPTKRDLISYLNLHDAEVGERTFQRDLADIRSNFDLEIIYDDTKKGYRVDSEGTLEFDKLLYFIGLAESSDIVLSCMKDKNRVLKYLSITPNPQAKGVENIGVLLRATQNQLVISFSHLNYKSKELKDYIVNPYLLKEFDSMWYLFAFVGALNSFRTFGLDRMTNIVTTQARFQRDRELEQTADKFNNVYGLVYEPEDDKNAPIESVVLRASDSMLPYLEALPLHHSQTICEDTVVLQLIINTELENKILSYGEHMEVLSPLSLRKRIEKRLKDALLKY